MSTSSYVTSGVKTEGELCSRNDEHEPRPKSDTADIIAHI